MAKFLGKVGGESGVLAPQDKWRAGKFTIIMSCDEDGWGAFPNHSSKEKNTKELPRRLVSLLQRDGVDARTNPCIGGEYIVFPKEQKEEFFRVLESLQDKDI